MGKNKFLGLILHDDFFRSSHFIYDEFLTRMTVKSIIYC